MKKHLTIAIAALLLAAISACAQRSSSDDYKLKKAIEVLQQDNDEEQGLKLLNEQLSSTPDNVEALFWRMMVLRNREEYGSALSDVNHAIKVNRPKKSGICMSTLWYWKAAIYSNLDDTQKAIDSYRTALMLAKKDKKENVQDISFNLAQMLYSANRFDESDIVYKEMLKEDEADQAALVGLARNCLKREQYQEAADLCEKSIKYDADYPSQYKFAFQAYEKLGKIDKAIDYIITLIDKDEDELNYELADILVKHKTYAVAKIQEKLKKGKDTLRWRILLESIYEKSHEWEKAIAEYDALEGEYGKDDVLYYHKAMCYDELGFTQKAISEINKAIEISPDEESYDLLGRIYRNAGMYDRAIETFDKVIELLPTNAYGYYAKGWCYELAGDGTKALALYNQGIDLDNDYAYIFVSRGSLLLKMGEKEQAEADFKKVIQLDTLAEDGSCRHYALHYLGHDDEAQEWMQKIIDKSPEDSGNWYDQACLFARMGRGDEAVQALEKCLSLGYCKFAHIAYDDDMDTIRDREDFMALIEKYSSTHEKRITEFKETLGEPIEALTTEVTISRRSGGTFEVPCSVNGLDLKMIFDTGASDVTISSVEANFMLKNDYLSTSDVKGKKYYQIANGDLSEGTVITLKEVKVGDAVLKNVDASVVKSQKAPLLLGQSVMERFGTITIDNINSKLIIKQ